MTSAQDGNTSSLAVSCVLIADQCSGCRWMMLDETLEGEKVSLNIAHHLDYHGNTVMEPDSASVMLSSSSSSSSIPTKSMASRQQPPLIKTYPYLARPQDVRRWRPWIQLAWFVHVLVTVSVLYNGIHSNKNARCV